MLAGMESSPSGPCHVAFQNARDADIRQRPTHLTVETDGSGVTWVQHIRTVGRRDNDKPSLFEKPSISTKQLVQCLLALGFVTPPLPEPTVTAHGVDLVDKDNAGRVLSVLLEQCHAHAGKTDTDEHLDEVGTGNE